MTTEVLVAAACAIHEAHTEKYPLAYRFGYEACLIGIRKGNNPFRVDCVNEWTQWRQGWQACFEELTSSTSSLSSAFPLHVSSQRG